jgi:hypothetical protein
MSFSVSGGLAGRRPKGRAGCVRGRGVRGDARGALRARSDGDAVLGSGSATQAFRCENSGDTRRRAPQSRLPPLSPSSCALAAQARAGRIWLSSAPASRQPRGEGCRWRMLRRSGSCRREGRGTRRGRLFPREVGHHVGVGAPLRRHLPSFRPATLHVSRSAPVELPRSAADARQEFSAGFPWEGTVHCGRRTAHHRSDSFRRGNGFLCAAGTLLPGEGILVCEKRQLPPPLRTLRSGVGWPPNTKSWPSSTTSCPPA